MKITFPGGYAVNAHYKGFEIPTDQPEDNGGANSAPAPFDLFLVSLGTCAAFYAMRFCQQRGLPTDELEFEMDTVDHPVTHRTEKIIMTIKVPTEFPEKYRRAIVRATNQCSVKRAILDPPEMVVETI
ncbi:MAG: OsmC family protein [Desulfuromonadales bacterium]|nr:OsmC family protein [Desulfuromonadales bacterium]